MLHYLSEFYLAAKAVSQWVCYTFYIIIQRRHIKLDASVYLNVLQEQALKPQNANL